jgi:hypothetical protein
MFFRHLHTSTPHHLLVQSSALVLRAWTSVPFLYSRWRLIWTEWTIRSWHD